MKKNKTSSPLLCCIFFFFLISLNAQPFDIVVFPATPNDAVPVSVNGEFTFDSGECMLLDINFSIDGFQINADASFATGVLQEVCNNQQSFDFGMLPAGDYIFFCVVTEFHFDLDNSCYVLQQSQVIETEFTVLPSVVECIISDVVAEAHPCDADGNFYADIEFISENTGAEGFHVVGNGENYGSFAYGQPFYTVGPIAGNGQGLEFIVQDIINPDCSAFTTLTAPVCEQAVCTISNLFVEAYNCDADGRYDIDLGFTIENGLGAGWELWVDGVLYEYFAAYPNNFITIPDFGIGEGQPVVITVVDNDNPEECSSIFTFEAPVCTVNCSIFDIVTDPAACDGEGTYSLFLNFGYEGNTNEFFDVWSGDSFIGFYAYADLPITIANFPERPTSDYDIITICDNDNPDCCSSLEFMGPDCVTPDCFIGEVFAEAHTCDADGNFYVDIEFISENTGAEGFHVVGNGENYGSFAYGQPFYTVGPIAGNGQGLEFIVQDIINPDCSAFTTLTAPVCEQAVCTISNLFVEAYNCDADGRYDIDLGFTIENGLGAGWELWIDGVLYEYFAAYPNNFITISDFGMGEGQPVVITVVDNDNSEECSSIFTFEAPVCTVNCSIFDIVTDPAACDGEGTYSLFLNFGYEGNTNEFFDVWSGDTFIGFYTYADLPITIANFPERPTSDYDIITICDNDNPDCCSSLEFMGPDCVTPDCFIGEVFAEAHPCDADGNFYVDIEFISENTGAEGFHVVGNGENYGSFAYGQPFYTVGPIAGNGQGLEFIVQDIINPDCSAFTTLTAPVCEQAVCTISNLFVEAYNCDADGRYDIDLGFTIENGLGAGWELWVDGVLYEYFAAYPNNFITIPDFGIGEGQPVVITVVDNDNPEECSSIFTFEAPVCTVNCSIFDIVTDPAACDGEGTYSLFLNFGYEGNTNDFFDVWSGDTFIGFYAYADLPITIANFPERPTSDYDIIRICDNDNPDCCSSLEFMGPDCVTPDCFIGEVFAEAHPCDADGNFYVDIEFISENTGAEGFQVVGNGENYGSFAYGQPFYTVGPIAGNGQGLEFIVQDIINPDCSAFTTLTAPVCEQAVCTISNLFVEAYNCDADGRYDIDLGFTIENGLGAGWELWVDGVLYEYFAAYPNNFITIPDFGIGEGQPVVITVVDNDNPEECSSIFTFEAPVCPITSPCSISNVSLTPTDCIEGQFFIVVDFIHEGTSGTFSFGGAGTGTYSYADLPVTIGPFEGNGQGMLFEIVDSEFGDCFAVEDMLAPLCETPECTINEVIAIPGECQGNGTFFVEISFAYVNTGMEGFRVQGNGNNYGNFEYGQASYLVGPIEGDGITVYEFVVQDNQFPDCNAFTVIDPVDCSVNFGIIENIMLTPHDCDEEQEFMVEVDFDYNNVSDAFFLMVNSVDEGAFNYDALPVLVGPYPGDGQTMYSFMISDPGASISAGAQLQALDCGFGTGIYELDNQPAVHIFNPAFSKQLQVEISEITNDEIQLRLFDAIGKLIYKTREKQTVGTYQVDLMRYPVGMYFCEVQIGKFRYVGKFMLQ